MTLLLACQIPHYTHTEMHDSPQLFRRKSKQHSWSYCEHCYVGSSKIIDIGWKWYKIEDNVTASIVHCGSTVLLLYSKHDVSQFYEVNLVSRFYCVENVILYALLCTQYMPVQYQQFKWESKETAQMVEEAERERDRERVNTSNNFVWFEFAFLCLSSPLSKEYHKKTSMLIIICAWQYKYTRMCVELREKRVYKTKRKEKRKSWPFYSSASAVVFVV